tara:strand:+ start:397 stop:579 length:183 start_codon:yes stop_codon:yes gene_type:complete
MQDKTIKWVSDEDGMVVEDKMIDMVVVGSPIRSRSYKKRRGIKVHRGKEPRNKNKDGGWW